MGNFQWFEKEDREHFDENWLADCLGLRALAFLVILNLIEFEFMDG